MRLLRKVVFDLLPGSIDTDAKQNLACAAMGVSSTNLSSSNKPLRNSTAALLHEDNLSSCLQQFSTQQNQEPQLQTAAWDALPAPALILIGAQLPRSSLPSIRMVCKAWAGHVTEVLTETQPSAFPLMAHEAARKDGNNTILLQLMREGLRCRHNDLHSSMLQSVSNHPGLQAALQQQIADCLTSWHASLNQLFVSSPFLTKLDLSRCAAVVSAEDYAVLTLQPHDKEALFPDLEERQAPPVTPPPNPDLHPCASAVIHQQALPISIRHLLPMLRRLPCLSSLHLQLTKISKSSIQLIAWAFKVEWQRQHFSLPELQFSFTPAGDTFIGHPTLTIVADDIIELTIYSDITHINIANHTEIGDMSIAALSLLPKLHTVMASGSPITNLGLIMLCSAHTITRLDLSKCTHITNQGATSLARLPSLLSLDLSDCNALGDPGLHSLLRGLTRLQHLSLQHCAHITDAGLAALSHSSQLTSLNLAVCRDISDEGVGRVAGLPRLHTLDLTFCDRITDAGVTHLSRLTQLQDLTLACCKLSPGGVGSLGALHSLTCLDLVGCVDGVTPDAMQALTSASSLKSLNLAFCSLLLDAGVQALAKLDSLSDLNLAYCKWITNDGISSLSSLTALTCLNLQGCSQTTPHLGKGLAALHAMSGLVSLNLGSCKLKAGSLLHLAGATQLTELSLRFCKGVRPQDLSAITSLHRLRQLDMTGCAACNDASLSHVADLRYLQKLNLSFNRHLTDQALGKLTVLSNLQHLSVNNCPCMTEAGLDCVLATMPSVTKVSTTESCEAEQFLLLQSKRVASCAASLQQLDGEQEPVVED